MFAKREFRIRMVKQDKTPPPPAPKIDEVIMDTIEHTRMAAKDLINYGAKMAAGYILLTTVREVAIQLATKK